MDSCNPPDRLILMVGFVQGDGNALGLSKYLPTTPSQNIDVSWNLKSQSALGKQLISIKLQLTFSV